MSIPHTSGQTRPKPRRLTPWSLRRLARARRTPLQRPDLETLEDRNLFAVSVAGSVFNDLNGNGLRDAGEVALAGVPVFIDLNANGALDNQATYQGPTALVPGTIAGVVRQVALPVFGLPGNVSDLNVQLNFAKDSTGTGNVTASLLSPAGIQALAGPDLARIAPGRSFNGTLDDQSLNAAVNAPASSPTGTFRPLQTFASPGRFVYNGVGLNGNWLLIFTGNAATGLTLNSWALSFAAPEPTAVTDADGNYTFSDLPNGTYQLRAKAPAAGNFPAQSVTVAAGQAATGDFAVQPVADLATLAFAVTTNPTDWGQTVEATYTIANRGAGPSGPFDVELRLSPSRTIDATGTLLQTIRLPGLAANSTTTGTVSVQLPGAPGQPPAGFTRVDSAFLGLRLDTANEVVETDEGNNANQGNATDLAPAGRFPNLALTTEASVQQQPSLVVNPLNPNHLVVAYMDYGLLNTGYAGIGVQTSLDGGTTWQKTSVPLPAGFDEAAGYPNVRFDNQGRVYLVFMAVDFLGPRPAVIFPEGRDANGRLFRSYGMEASNGIFLTRSDNGGTTWNTPVAVTSRTYTPGGTQVPYDTLPDLAIDTFPTRTTGAANTFFGNVYVTWSRYYPAGQFPAPAVGTTAQGGSEVFLAVSTNAGQTFTTRTQTVRGEQVSILRASSDASDPPGGGRANISHLTIGNSTVGGIVYPSFVDNSTFRMFRSLDAGATFPLTTFPFTNLTGFIPNTVLPNNNFRTFPVRGLVADPARPGTLYAYEAFQTINTNFNPPLIDAAEIYMARSIDNGANWVRYTNVGTNPSNINELALNLQPGFLTPLNDDNANRLLSRVTNLGPEAITGQALPRLTVDNQGNIAAIWLDTRRDPNNHALDVYGTRSTDGGYNFSPNFRVTDASFDADAGNRPEVQAPGVSFLLGDFLGLAAANGTAYAAWTDTRNGNQDIYFTRFLIAPASEPAADRFEANNAPASATDLGAVSAQRSFPRLALAGGDADWFRFTTPAAGELFLEVAAAGGATPDLALFDGAGNPVAQTPTVVTDSTGRVTARQYRVPVQSGQAFQARVLGGPVGAASIPYTLTVRALTEDLGTQVHNTRSGSIGAGGQAIYALTAAVAGSLEVRLDSLVTLATETGQVGNINLQVLDGETLAVIANGQVGQRTGNAETETLSIPVAAGQRVQLVVTGVTPVSQGQFTLAFTNLDQYQTAQQGALFFEARGNPVALVSVDANNDGKPDVVTTTTDLATPITVLLNNGDGTLATGRSYEAGPGSASGFRGLATADFNGDNLPDLAVSNYNAADTSVLLGRPDGTFSVARRADAVSNPHSIAPGDFDEDGKLDLVFLKRVPAVGEVTKVAVLRGHGDGTFDPPVHLATTLSGESFPVRTGDFNRDGNLDLVVFGLGEALFNLFLGHGDGTFADPVVLATPERTVHALVVDLNGDANPDLVLGSNGSGNVYTMLGKGDGTFSEATAYFANTDPARTFATVPGLVLADVGNASVFGTPDGIPDLVAVPIPGVGRGLPQVVFLPGLTTGENQFAGFGPARQLALGRFSGSVAVADLNGDNAPEIIAADAGGVRVLYGKPPSLTNNDDPATPRDLGSVLHVVTPPLAISPEQKDAYFKYSVPPEIVPGAGDQVLDVSARFENVQGAGLGLEVTDAQGNVLGSGTRFRLVAAQGATLTFHVFGLSTDNDPVSSGVYSLVIDVLPQVVSIEAPSLLPGAGGQPGSAASTLVVTLQGDRLDPATAENPANYKVTWLGSDGLFGTDDDRVLPLTTADGQQAVVYNPEANLTASSGRTTPTEVRQTVTLVFAEALLAGSYRVEFGAGIRTADYNPGEGALLTPREGFNGHALVSVRDGAIVEGAAHTAPGLVVPPVAQNLGALGAGTTFLTQLHADLAALLDAQLTALGDDPSITLTLLQQILARLAPAAGGTSFLVLFLDPVGFDLADPSGQRVQFDVRSGAAAQSTVAKSFAEVGRNNQLVVLADAAGTFRLNVSSAQPTARGGAVILGADGSQVVTSLTPALRGGTTDFSFNVAAAQPGAPGQPGAPVPPGPVAGPTTPPVTVTPTPPSNPPPTEPTPPTPPVPPGTPVPPVTTPPVPPVTPVTGGAVTNIALVALVSSVLTAPTGAAAAGNDAGVAATPTGPLGPGAAADRSGPPPTAGSGYDPSPVPDPDERGPLAPIPSALRDLGLEAWVTGGMPAVKALEASSSLLGSILESLVGSDLPMTGDVLRDVGAELLGAVMPSVKGVGELLAAPARGGILPAGMDRGNAPPVGPPQQEEEEEEEADLPKAAGEEADPLAPQGDDDALYLYLAAAAVGLAQPLAGLRDNKTRGWRCADRRDPGGALR